VYGKLGPSGRPVPANNGIGDFDIAHLKEKAAANTIYTRRILNDFVSYNSTLTDFCDGPSMYIQSSAASTIQKAIPTDDAV
jgi:hypothetical protein